MIPLIDLNLQYQSIKDEIDKAIQECISNGIFINGKIVSDFENSFAKYIGTEYCLGCGNGTDALEIILKALGIGHGDEVIVPALTWIATAEAVNNTGGEPVFADINAGSYTINVQKISEKITRKTRAIIAVHLYGCPADMNQLLQITKENNIFLIEDCAQSHGAEYSGKRAGTFGIASAFSFFPSKNLGAFGDSGAIVTNDKALAEKMRKIANHGQLEIRHKHFLIGRNSRLDALQASILKVKLKYLDEWNEKRRQNALYYLSRLMGKTDLILPVEEQGKKHVYHQFVIRCKYRDKMLDLLREKHISWGIHYPKPVPLLDAYNYKKHKSSDFPVASRITDEIISVPVYPEMNDDQLEIVCDQLLKHQ